MTTHALRWSNWLKNNLDYDTSSEDLPWVEFEKAFSSLGYPHQAKKPLVEDVLFSSLQPFTTQWNTQTHQEAWLSWLDRLATTALNQGPLMFEESLGTLLRYSTVTGIQVMPLFETRCLELLADYALAEDGVINDEDMGRLPKYLGYISRLAHWFSPDARQQLHKYALQIEQYPASSYRHTQGILTLLNIGESLPTWTARDLQIYSQWWVDDLWKKTLSRQSPDVLPIAFQGKAQLQIASHWGVQYLIQGSVPFDQFHLSNIEQSHYMVDAILKVWKQVSWHIENPQTWIWWKDLSDIRPVSSSFERMDDVMKQYFPKLNTAYNEIFPVIQSLGGHTSVEQAVLIAEAMTLRRLSHEAGVSYTLPELGLDTTS